MRIPRPTTILLAVVALTLAGLVIARVSAQVGDSPTEHPPIVVPSSSVAPSPSASATADDDDDDGAEQIRPSPRGIDDDDDDDRGPDRDD